MQAFALCQGMRMAPRNKHDPKVAKTHENPYYGHTLQSEEDFERREAEIRAAKEKLRKYSTNKKDKHGPKSKARVSDAILKREERIKEEMERMQEKKKRPSHSAPWGSAPPSAAQRNRSTTVRVGQDKALQEFAPKLNSMGVTGHGQTHGGLNALHDFEISPNPHNQQQYQHQHQHQQQQQQQPRGPNLPQAPERDNPAKAQDPGAVEEDGADQDFMEELKMLREEHERNVALIAKLTANSQGKNGDNLGDQAAATAMSVNAGSSMYSYATTKEGQDASEDPFSAMGDSLRGDQDMPTFDSEEMGGDNGMWANRVRASFLQQSIESVRDSWDSNSGELSRGKGSPKPKKMRPKSAAPSRKSRSPRSTLSRSSEPFAALEARETLKKKSISQRRMEEELLRKSVEAEAELKVRFRAKEIPASTIEPRYQQMILDQAARSDANRKAGAARLRQSQKPFKGMAKREQDRQRKRDAQRRRKEAELKREREKLQRDHERIRNSTSRVPPPSKNWKEREMEEDEIRERRRKQRQEKLMKGSSLPRCMLKHQEAQKVKKTQRDREHKQQTKVLKSVAAKQKRTSVIKDKKYWARVHAREGKKLKDKVNANRARLRQAGDEKSFTAPSFYKPPAPLTEREKVQRKARQRDTLDIAHKPKKSAGDHLKPKAPKVTKSFKVLMKHKQRLKEEEEKKRQAAKEADRKREETRKKTSRQIQELVKQRERKRWEEIGKPDGNKSLREKVLAKSAEFRRVSKANYEENQAKLKLKMDARTPMFESLGKQQMKERIKQEALNRIANAIYSSSSSSSKRPDRGGRPRDGYGVFTEGERDAIALAESDSENEASGDRRERSVERSGSSSRKRQSSLSSSGSSDYSDYGDDFDDDDREQKRN